MINSTEAIRALSEKLESMSHEEREEYFKKMGFSFKNDFMRYVSVAEQLFNKLQ